MHKLVAHQLRSAAKPDGSIDIEALTAVMMRTYDEFDRERRLTDRAAKLMEEELQEANAQVRRLAEQRLADTLESMPSPIAMLTSSHRIQSVNSAMAALGHSVSRSTRIGESFQDLLCSLAPGADDGVAMSRLLQGESLEMAIGGRWYLCSAHRFSDGGLSVTFSDVTVMKERESVLAMARDAAESASRLKSQFLATMSHELRTPLNAILGFSEMIFSRVLGDGPEAWTRYFDYAQSIHASGDHLRLLISEVLDLSKIDSGAYHLTFEHCSMSELVADSTLLVRPQAERGQIRLLPLRIEGDIHLKADGRALKQVLVNLLSNAVKFTPKGGEVEVMVENQGENIQICVRDTGIGIAEEHKKSVFEPFHQGDARIARRYEGTGLGLSIVRGIVEMHGGKVWLESEPHIGTRVFFCLPRGDAQALSAA